MLKTKVRHCAHSFVPESIKELLLSMDENEKYVDIKIVKLNIITSLVILIYKTHK